MLSSGLPLLVLPSPKWTPMWNGVTDVSILHDDTPAWQSELPQCTGRQFGRSPIPAPIKSSTMQGRVIRSVHGEYSWRPRRPAVNDRKKDGNEKAGSPPKKPPSSPPDPSSCWVSSSCGVSSCCCVSSAVAGSSPAAGIPVASSISAGSMNIISSLTWSFNVPSPANCDSSAKAGSRLKMEMMTSIYHKFLRESSPLSPGIPPIPGRLLGFGPIRNDWSSHGSYWMLHSPFSCRTHDL